MKIWFPIAMTLLCLASAVTCSAGTYPEPAIVQAPSQWTLNVAYSTAKQITLKLPGENEPKRFWYIILTLTNNSTSSDAPFYPSCDLLTDTFKIVPAGKGLRREVFRQIKLKHQGRYPFLEPIDQQPHLCALARAVDAVDGEEHGVEFHGAKDRVEAVILRR